MRNSILLLSASILCICLITQPSQACTTFCLDKGDQLVVGKNYDWYIGDGLVIVNKQNVSKTAMPISAEDGQPATWTSKYGSVTFNMYGREFPMEGINEAGLVVQILMLAETEYPAPDSRPYIGLVQWLQYQLDNFSTIEEVIASDSQLRIQIRENGQPIHYLISDSMGNCAIIEFIGGKMVYYTNETMPVKTLTNSTYEKSVEFMYQHMGWGGDLPIPQGESSLDRFVRAADMVRNYDMGTSASAVDYAFDTLESVAQSREVSATQWSIVYDIQNLRIYFCTLENKQIRYINLSSFNFSCKTPVKVLDINDDLSGDVENSFIDYTYEINRDLIEKSYNLYDFTDEILDYIAHYPESTVCNEIDCFIATAAYGSPMEPQVEILRKFRDHFLFDNTVGKSFVNLYNTYSPPIADFIAKHDNVRAMVRLNLLPIIGVSWLTLKLGPVTTMLLMLLLLALMSTTMVLIFKKRG